MSAVLDEDTWWELILSSADSNDTLVWMAFADWLEEGQRAGDAFAVRWLGRNRLRPRREYQTRLNCSEPTSYDWLDADHTKLPSFPCDYALLPWFVYDALPRPEEAGWNWAGDEDNLASFREYPSAKAAYLAALAAVVQASRDPLLLPLFDAFDPLSPQTTISIAHKRVRR